MLKRTGHRDGLAIEAGAQGAARQIAAAAKAALDCSQIYMLRKLQVEPDGKALILSGHVESFYHKQLAQELVRGAAPGAEVVNVIQVVYNRERSLTESDFFRP
ncbi:MAG TPA: BON domain-containing protein [Pirellulaceae bacterium]|nr:BON domain-containing protein [Pirellulaceae bacterium]